MKTPCKVEAKTKVETPPPKTETCVKHRLTLLKSIEIYGMLESRPLQELFSVGHLSKGVDPATPKKCALRRTSIMKKPNLVDHDNLLIVSSHQACYVLGTQHGETMQDQTPLTWTHPKPDVSSPLGRLRIEQPTNIHPRRLLASVSSRCFPARW